MKHLEREVEQTASAVALWKNNQAKITAAIADANARLAKAAAHKKASALDASLGNPKATLEISQARTEHAAATAELGDLGDALNDAVAKLAEAEVAAQSARAALAMHHAQVKMRHRIRLTATLDALLVEVAAVVVEYDASGAEIANTQDVLAPANMFGTSSIGRLDEIRGNRRLRAAIAAAMGTRLEKVYPNASFDEKRAEKLEDSETRVWSLPPDETTAKAA